jgi:flagellar basal-body rod modification protein FlgD
MDNNQLTSQLAQINMTAGVEKLNSSVAGVQAMMVQLGSMSASSWVGRSVLIEGEAKVSFGEPEGMCIHQVGADRPGGSDDFHFVLAGDAETVTVTLHDGDKAYTAELKNVKKGINTYNLDDLENFKPEPGPPHDREYTLSFEASNPEGEKPEVVGLVPDQVQGVTMDPNGPILHLVNNDPIGMGQVVVIQK